MFTINLSESLSKTVDLPSMDSTTIVCIINHVYNFKTILSTNNVRNLLHTCHMLEVDDLTKDCERYMFDDIDIANCIDYYQDAALFQLKRLERKAKRYILCKYEQVCVTDRFLSLSEYELVDLISSDDLTVESELIVFNSVVRWLTCNSTSQKEINVFQYVRFEHMSTESLEKLLDIPLIQTSDHQVYVRTALKYHASCLTTNNQTKVKAVRTGLLNEKFVTITKDKHIVSLSINATDDVYDKKRSVSAMGDLTSTFCVTSNGILVCGGMESRKCVSYDIKNDQLDVFTEMLSQRWGHAAVVDMELLYVCGGYDGRRTLNTVHCLDMKKKMWKVLANMKKAVNWPLIAHFKDKILVFGGIDSVISLQIYDKFQNKWIFGNDMPKSCDSIKGGVVVHNDIIHTVCHGHCLAYTPATDTWTTMVYDRIGEFISQPILYQGLVTVFSITKNNFKLMSLDVNNSSWAEKRRLRSDFQMIYVAPWNYIIKPFLCIKCPVM